MPGQKRKSGQTPSSKANKLQRKFSSQDLGAMGLEHVEKVTQWFLAPQKISSHPSLQVVSFNVDITNVPDLGVQPALWFTLNWTSCFCHEVEGWKKLSFQRAELTNIWRKSIPSRQCSGIIIHHSFSVSMSCKADLMQFAQWMDSMFPPDETWAGHVHCVIASYISIQINYVWF